MEIQNLTVEHVAQILNVSRQTIWKKCQQGQLPAYKIPGSRRWLIGIKDFEKLQRDLKNKTIWK